MNTRLLGVLVGLVISFAVSTFAQVTRHPAANMCPIQEGYADTNGVLLHYTEFGKGSPLSYCMEASALRMIFFLLYWVNAMDGRPFFVVSCAVDPGLLSLLRDQIVPRLKADVPNQPTDRTEAIPDTARVINPAWRQLDSQVRRQNALLSRELLQFAEIQLPSIRIFSSDRLAQDMQRPQRDHCESHRQGTD